MEEAGTGAAAGEAVPTMATTAAAEGTEGGGELSGAAATSTSSAGCGGRGG